MGAKDAMVEVERKVFLTSQQRDALVAALPPGREKSFWDVYYDGPGLPLTTRDWWLRQRGSSWELKLPALSGHSLDIVQSYEEVVDSGAIAERLAQVLPRPSLPDTLEGSAAEAGEGLMEALAKQDIVPFAKLHTTRLSIDTAWGHDGTTLTLDLDSVTFDASLAEEISLQEAAPKRPFMIAEVEVMVPKGTGAESSAAEALEAFLAAQGLTGAPQAYSKLLEYLLLFRPAHLEALSAAGIVPKAKLAKLRAASAKLPRE